MLREWFILHWHCFSRERPRIPGSGRGWRGGRTRRRGTARPSGGVGGGAGGAGRPRRGGRRRRGRRGTNGQGERGVAYPAASAPAEAERAKDKTGVAPLEYRLGEAPEGGVTPPLDGALADARRVPVIAGEVEDAVVRADEPLGGHGGRGRASGPAPPSRAPSAGKLPASVTRPGVGRERFLQRFEGLGIRVIPPWSHSFSLAPGSTTCDHDSM